MLFWQVIIEVRLVTDLCVSMYTEHCSSRSTLGDAEPQAHVVIASQHIGTQENENERYP